MDKDKVAMEAVLEYFKERGITTEYYGNLSWNLWQEKRIKEFNLQRALRMLLVAGKIYARDTACYHRDDELELVKNG